MEPDSHLAEAYPRSQGALVRRARAGLSQVAFAQQLGIERSCLSRYENEKLGAPTKVINHCLSAIAAQMDAHAERSGFNGGVRQALDHARQAVTLLEREAGSAPR